MYPKEVATLMAEAHADLAEQYREALARFTGASNTYKRYVMREQMVYHQDRAAGIMAQWVAQAVQP